MTGSSLAMACWIMKWASTGSEQQTTRRPAVCAKYASFDSLWCSTAPMPPPTGIRTTTGSVTAPSARAHLGQLRHDLVEGRVDEAVELDLAHGAVATQCHADGGADDARLGQRRVDHPVLTEVLLQAVRHPEDPAELADVLAHQDDLGVGLHRGAQAGVDAPGERDRRHQ